MSFIGDSPKLKRTRYKPQSTDPVNPIEGDVFYSDGTPRAEGLWLYQNGSWITLASTGLRRVEFVDKEFVTVRCATTANVTLASQVENGDTIDGIVLATNDLVLLKNQTTTSENGVYVVQASGAPVRATSADTAAKLSRLPVYVENGTLNQDTQWWQQNDLTSLTDAQVWYGGRTNFQANVRCASTANVVLASGVEAGDVIDGVTLRQSDLVLLKNQSTPSENGVYSVNLSGAPTRASFADAFGELNRLSVSVREGTTNANTVWWQTATLVSLASSQTWEQVRGPAPYTWTVPSGVSQIILTAAGGGGGGGASVNRAYAQNALSTATFRSGGGGGAGAVPQEVALDVQFGDSLSITCGPGGLGGYSVLNSLHSLMAGAGYDTVVTRTGPSGAKTLRFLGAPQGVKGAFGTDNATYRDMSIPGGGHKVFLGKNGAILPTSQEFTTIDITKGGFSGGSGEGPGTTNYVLDAYELPRALYAWDIYTYILGNRYAVGTEGVQTANQLYDGLPGESSQYGAGGRGGRGLSASPNFCGAGGGGGAGFGDGAAGGDGQASTNMALADGPHAAAGSSAGGGGGACTYAIVSASLTRAGRGGRGGSGKVIITY